MCQTGTVVHQEQRTSARRTTSLRQSGQAPDAVLRGQLLARGTLKNKRASPCQGPFGLAISAASPPARLVGWEKKNPAQIWRPKLLLAVIQVDLFGWEMSNAVTSNRQGCVQQEQKTLALQRVTQLGQDQHAVWNMPQIAGIYRSHSRRKIAWIILALLLLVAGAAVKLQHNRLPCLDQSM